MLGLTTLLGATLALAPMWATSFKAAFPSGWPLLVILGSISDGMSTGIDLLPALAIAPILAFAVHNLL